jgi:type I restriction-modification system DNA methylase subunit
LGSHEDTVYQLRVPNGVFAPYTGIKTNLLFFTKGNLMQWQTKSCQWTWCRVPNMK